MTVFQSLVLEGESRRLEQPADLSIGGLLGTAALVDQEVLRLIADAIAAVGSSEFPAAIARLCLHVTHFDSAFMCAFFTGHKPLPIYSDLNEEQDRRTVIPYLGFAYLLDPFYELSSQLAGDRVVGLNDCAPDDFRASDYYRMFYADTGLSDELGVLVSFGADASVLISLGSRDERIHCSARAKATLGALVNVIANLCRQNWPRLAPTSQNGLPRRDNHL
ncbi:MAG: hypothetical protein ABIQ51_07890 [Mesorhizobium sp.]